MTLRQHLEAHLGDAASGGLQSKQCRSVRWCPRVHSRVLRALFEDDVLSARFRHVKGVLGSMGYWRRLADVMQHSEVYRRDEGKAIAFTADGPQVWPLKDHRMRHVRFINAKTSVLHTRLGAACRTRSIDSPRR